MNFFAIHVFSFVPPKYKKLVKEGSGKVFGALVLCFILLSLVTAFRGISAMGEVKQSIIKDCPEFELRNGEFSIEKPFLFDYDNVYCEIDDSIDEVSAADVEKISKGKKYSSVIIIGRKGLGSYDDGKIQTIDFDDLKGFNVSKDILVDTWLPALNVIIIACCVIGALFSIGIYYLMSLILQFLTGVFSKGFFKTELSEKERFRITVLGKFPPYILVWVLKLFNIRVIFLIRLLIQLGYIILVLYFYAKSREGEMLQGQYISQPPQMQQPQGQWQAQPQMQQPQMPDQSGQQSAQPFVYDPSRDN